MDSFSTSSSSWFPSSSVQKFYAYAPFAVQAYRVVEKKFSGTLYSISIIAIKCLPDIFLCVSKGLAASEAQIKSCFSLIRQNKNTPMWVNFGHCTKSNLQTYKLIISTILYITNAAVQKLLQHFKPFPSDQRVPRRNKLKREKKSMVSGPRRRSQW